MPKLKLQYFSHMIQRTDSLEKKLMLGKIKGKRRRGRQRIRWLDSITNLIDMNLSKFWEMVKVKEAWHTAVHGDEKSQTQLRDWKTTILDKHKCKNPQQILANWIEEYSNRWIYEHAGFIPGMQRWFNICKSTGVTELINKMGNKNHRILSVDSEKKKQAFDEINIHLL